MKKNHKYRIVRRGNCKWETEGNMWNKTKNWIIILCPFALYYLPNRFMSNFLITRIFCRVVSVVLSALAVYNVNTLYFNARSFPEKSAKTGNLSIIKTQCPNQLSCSHIRWSLVWRWRKRKSLSLIQGLWICLWSQWDIKLPMYRWFWKFGRLFFVFGQITLWTISLDILRGPRLFWPPKLSRAQRGTI